MQQRSLGSAFNVSELALGGGGIGQVWGATDRREAEATVRAAADAGITLFDMAPIYGKDSEAERVLGSVFDAGYPDGIRVSSKCMLGTVPGADVLPKLSASIGESLKRMKRDHLDLFVLHGYVVPDGFGAGSRAASLARVITPWSLYVNAVVPAMQSLQASGLILAWGITAGLAESTLAVFQHSVKPHVAQCVCNLLDSSGSMNLDRAGERPGELIGAAHRQGVGVMGIRAVAAGALTARMDRQVDEQSAEGRDYQRAVAFRRYAEQRGEDPAVLAHRYALSYPEVDTVVLGVKNRAELNEVVAATALPKLTADEMAELTELGRARATGV